MSRNTYRDENDTDQPDSYWHRRVITLAAGLSLLGLLAWAFSGGGGKPASPAPRSSPASGILPAAAYSGAPARSSGASGSGSASANPTVPGLPVPSAGSAPSGAAGASGASGAASARPGSAAGGTSAGAKSALGQPAATSTAPGATPPGSGQEPGGRCPPGAVVLSLFSSSAEYYAGQDPEFAVDAVSTASGACSFAVGPSQLQLVVMQAGRIIWDSADCPRGDQGRVAELSRGVPAQVSVTWNRAITLPGCVTLVSAVRPGSYQVQARAATGDSPVRTITLARLTLADA